MNQSLDSGLDLLANFSKKSKALIPTINGGTFAEDLSAALSGDQVFDSSAVENSVEAAIRTMEENIDKFEKQNANYDKALAKGLNEKFLKSLKDMGEDGEDIIAGFAEASTDDIAKANSLWAKKQQYANEALKKSLQGSIDAMEEWSYDITRLAQKGVDEGLLREIAEAGPEAQAYLDALLSMTDSELRQFSNLYSNAQNLAVSATDQAIAAMAVNGALAAGSFAKAISDYDLLANSGDIAYNYIAFLEGMGVEMNDTAWTVGRDAILALAKGLLDEEAIDTATSNASSAGSSIGKAMSDGVASGGKEAEKQFKDLSINWDGNIAEIAEEIQHKIINSDGTINDGIAQEMQSIGGFTTQQIYDLAVLAREDLANGGGYQVYWGARDMFYEMKQAGIDENSPEWLKRYVEETTDAAVPTQTQQRKIQSGYDALCNKTQYSLQTEGAKSKTEAREVTAGVTKELTPTVSDTSKVKTGVKKLDNDGVKKPLKESNSPAIAKQTGEYTGDGYALGLLSKIPAVTAAATALANAANRAMQSTAMVASPSKFTKWLGNMIGDGFVVGMKAKEDAVGAEAQHIADASLSAFQDSVKTALLLSNELNSAMSVSPSIKPVIDLDAVRSQAIEMHSILGNEDGSVSMRLASNVDDGLIRSLQTSEIMRRSLDEYQRESTSQMSQLSSNFDGLRDDLANLENAMSGMAIVMDSGELVGAITTGIDTQLGKNVKYSKRGLA
jgi:roadblock/LC7 domain-containing protein